MFSRTDRLILRRWRDADRGPFARLNADRQVMAFYPRTLSVEDTSLEPQAFYERQVIGIELILRMRFESAYGEWGFDQSGGLSYRGWRRFKAQEREQRRKLTRWIGTKSVIIDEQKTLGHFRGCFKHATMHGNPVLQRKVWSDDDWINIEKSRTPHF